MLKDNIIDVIKYQRGLIYVILFRILLLLAALFRIIPPDRIIILAVIGLSLLVAMLFMIVQLLGAMDYGFVIVILCCILVFFPLIGLITLLVINGRATKILREAGLRVGLMGVNPGDLQQISNN